jgi:hypothetical protein
VVVVGLVAFAGGAGARLARADRFGADQPNLVAPGDGYPSVSPTLPDHEYVIASYEDRATFGDADIRVTSSLIEPLVDGEMRDADGLSVRFQIRGDEYYTLPGGSEEWTEVEAGAVFAGLGDTLSETIFTIDEMVPPRVRPFVEVVDDSVEVLPIYPIGDDLSADPSFDPFADTPSLDTRRLRLRVDHSALADADPLATWWASRFGEDGMTLWIDADGFVRQLELGDEEPALLRIVGTASSAPELERQLETGEGSGG